MLQHPSQNLQHPKEQRSFRSPVSAVTIWEETHCNQLSQSQLYPRVLTFKLLSFSVAFIPCEANSNLRDHFPGCHSLRQRPREVRTPAISCSEMRQNCWLKCSDTCRNGVATEEDIYNITYYGKGRMPASVKQS